MTKLYSVNTSFLDDNDRMRLREVTDQLVRYVEDLDSIRDRASVTQEELVNKLSEQINTRMYVLSPCGSDIFTSWLLYRAIRD